MAFKPTQRSKHGTNINQLSMASSFGVQKLGEKVSDPGTEIKKKTKEKESVLFKRDDVGSGMDERKKMVTADDITAGLDQMSRLDKFYRQQSLLMSLEEKSVLGTMDKLKRVQLGASEGLLPSSFEAPSSVQGPSVQAGDLLDDWEFGAF
jgi:hypothetical protein